MNPEPTKDGKEVKKMKKMLKRGLSMLFVVALIASMLTLPASAYYARFFTNKGGMLERSMKQGGTCDIDFTFAGDCIAKVDCSYGYNGAPSRFFVGNGHWNRWNGNLSDSMCSGTLRFRGGQPGVYYYTLYLLDGSRNIVCTQSIRISVHR